MTHEHNLEALLDAREMERNSILGPDTTDADWEINCLKGRIDELESDCMTMALRLLGEHPATFAPETREVMERWGKKAHELLQEVPQ